MRSIGLRMLLCAALHDLFDSNDWHADRSGWRLSIDRYCNNRIKVSDSED